MNKGQMEIFGLAIVMLLFLLGLIIFLRLSGTEDLISTNYLFQEMPTKTLKTMMETTTSCRDQDVETLIRDVASHAVAGGGTACSMGTGRIHCDPVLDLYSDDILGVEGGGALDTILDESLTIANIPHEFTLTLPSCVIYEKTPNACQGKKNIYAETFVLTSEKGNVEAQLRIC